MTHTIITFALVLAGGRNLFQYVEKPVQVKPRVAVQRQVVVEQPASVVETQREEPPPQSFEFPFRYIGSFGPDGNPIAVLVGENVLTVRTGDAFAGAFVLREIGAGRVLVSRGEIVKSVALSQ